MTPNTALVLDGFLRLSESEKKEVIAEVEQYVQYPHSTTKSLSESIRRVDLGPVLLTNRCPCCNR